MQTFGVFALVPGPTHRRAVLGHFGDKIGPKRTLTLTIVGMGVATFAIGVLPGYASIGIAAPLLLLVARMMQSFCAAGEYSGAAVLLAEHAPANKRARWVSTVPIATSAGFLGASVMASLLNGLLPEEAVQGGAGGSRSWPRRCSRSWCAGSAAGSPDSPVREQMEKEGGGRDGRRCSS